MRKMAFPEKSPEECRNLKWFLSTKVRKEHQTRLQHHGRLCFFRWKSMMIKIGLERMKLLRLASTLFVVFEELDDDLVPLVFSPLRTAKGFLIPRPLLTNSTGANVVGNGRDAAAVVGASDDTGGGPTETCSGVNKDLARLGVWAHHELNAAAYRYVNGVKGENGHSAIEENDDEDDDEYSGEERAGCV